jgi:hypothetical protein
VTATIVLTALLIAATSFICWLREPRGNDRRKKQPEPAMLLARFTTFNRETGETFIVAHDGRPESVQEAHECVDDWLEDADLNFHLEDAFVMHRMIAAEADAREFATSVGEQFFKALEEADTQEIEVLRPEDNWPEGVDLGGSE